MKSRAPFPHLPLLTLSNLRPAVFLRRRNRFVGIAEIGGSRFDIHVADPGRLTELLYPGNSILVRPAPIGSHRRTRWSLMAGMGESGWVLLNTFLHRRIAESLLSKPAISPFGELRAWKAEVCPAGFASRFDFHLEPEEGGPVWLEVKGCTLKRGRRALFPDAPTTRGTRHMKELAVLSRDGNRCAVMFLVFPGGVQCFAPNGMTDPDFEAAFREALDSGVTVHPLQLGFNGSEVTFSDMLPICPGF
ncbi:MAG: DNA/RNA nuclease SfsA [Candidatus Fermentibacteraceae bacterium]|nr:DNA/RNA nuclease SfsA [Candidatus Fermentibacteraceae bacterium]MBN2607555.1 DNA/RNA nuclease SfsA [Candidatus Fermentibacteraceae bacterium]